MAVVKTLYVQVGGLCMIVQEDNPARLSLLLPTFNHPNHLHCPYLIVSREYAGRDELVSLSGRSLDLSVLGSGGRVQPLPSAVLHVTRTARPDPVQVDPHWLSDARPSGALAARVRLPLSAEPIHALGSPADLEVHHANGAHEQVRVHGRVGIEIAVDGGASSLPLRDLGLELKPDANGAIELGILNVRPKDLTGRKLKHRRGEHAHHLAAYYRLLYPRNRWSVDLERPPMIHAATDVEGRDDTPGDVPCAQGRYHPLPRWSGGPQVEPETHDEGVLFIDPFNCTVGGGCPTPDAC